MDIERLVQFTRAIIEDAEDSAGAAMYGLALSWGIVHVSDEAISAEDVETRCARFALSDDIVWDKQE